MRPVARLQAVAAGLTMPVSLEHGCRAGGCRVGSEVWAVTTQRVPLSASEYLPQGAKVHGAVVTSDEAAKGSGGSSSLAIRFDSLRYAGGSVPLTVSVVAVAGMMEVNDSAAPTNAVADREIGGEANWTTRQVGGDVLARSGWMGELDNSSMQKVGFADFHGVYALPATPGGVPLALGVFSADAHGLYGFDPATELLPIPGTLSIRCGCKLVLRRGDNLLLRVEQGG